MLEIMALGLGLILIIGLIIIFIRLNGLTSAAILQEKLDSLAAVLEERFAYRWLQFEGKLNLNFSELQQRLNYSSSELRLQIVEFEKKLLLNTQQTNQDLLTQILTFKQQIATVLNEEVNKLISTLRVELDKLNQRVEVRLREGFDSTTKTFQNILERLGKIDAAQKKLDELSGEIVSLQEVLTDKKSRGIFGEVQLKQILVAAFGAGGGLYSLQAKLSTGALVDALISAPEPLGRVACDAKFPLENYRRMIDMTLTADERKTAEKLFEQNVKKHIDDIAMKYIIPGETADQAIMFIPAEAIIATIHAYHGSLIEYSHSKRVWLSSPTTLMAQLSTLQIVLRNLEREQHAQVIHDNLIALGAEFVRYKERWDGLAKHIDTVAKDVREIHTTTQKIGTRFERIAKVDIAEIN
jgi:DNA recombination protein RmuC